MFGSLAIYVRQDDVQNDTSQNQYCKACNLDDSQRLVPIAVALCPCSHLQTKQATQQGEQSQISVVTGQQCVNTDSKASQHERIGQDHPEPVLKAVLLIAYIGKLGIELIKIIHKYTP